MSNNDLGTRTNRITNKLRPVYLIVLALYMVFASTVAVFAEGSISMISPKTNTLAHRPYSYWANTTNLGIPRQQVIKVYANKDETIYFGSSVTKSPSVKVTAPDGTNTNYNISSSSNGYLNTTTKEQAGPRYTDKGVVKNPNGYTPHTINVSQSGVYVFEFYSPTPSGTTQPTSTTVSADWSTNGSAVVPAWDVTVVKGVGTGVSETVKGRVYTDYLALIMGKFFMNTQSDWGKGLYSKVYVLTDDGYIYETDFNGLDPNGFLFFANSRGLINPNNNSSLYHSARGTDDNLANLKVTMPSGHTINPTVHLPNMPDTALDKTHKIFFEMPSEDLPDSIRATPYMPGIITDFKFVGEDDNIGYEGEGGIFSFNVTSGSSYQIIIEFAENYRGTGRPANKLYLSNACSPGYNSIHWDGRDGNGEVVPAGLYGDGEEADGSIKVFVQVKAGEYHFPMLDAENNPFGVKIRLVNTPYNADGTLHEWKSEAEEEAARTTIYYDNSLIISKGSTASTAKRNQVVGGRTRGSIWDEIDQQLYALDGIISADGACRFMGTYAGSQGSSTDAWIYAGDHAFVDIWTYTANDRSEAEGVLEQFELLPKQSASKSIIRGLAYFESNHTSYSSSANYNIQQGDYALENIKVELYDGSTLVGTTYTDIHGYYNFYGLDQKNYSVRVYAPYNFAEIPTHRNTAITSTPNKYVTMSTGVLSVGITEAVNNNTKTFRTVGFNYALYAKNLQVAKSWAKTMAQDPARPSSITVYAIGSYNNIDYITVPVVLNNDNGWTHTFYDLPARNDNNQLLTYRIEEAGSEGYITSYSVQETDGGKTTLYTITNNPREFRIIKQLDRAASQDQFFMFLVEGDTDSNPGTDISFNVLIKVPAGATQAIQRVTHIHEGTYTVTELVDHNWRYEFDSANSEGTKDNVTEATSVNDSITMSITDKADYDYIFVNNLEKTGYLDYATGVTNKMKPLS